MTDWGDPKPFTADDVPKDIDAYLSELDERKRLVNSQPTLVSPRVFELYENFVVREMLVELVWWRKLWRSL